MDDGSALHWSEVTASSLLGIGVDNEIVENGSLGGQPEESAACIHLGLRRIQPRAKVELGLVYTRFRSSRQVISNNQPIFSPGHDIIYTYLPRIEFEILNIFIFLI